MWMSLKSAAVTLLAIVVLAGGLVPACMGGGCCVKELEASVHNEMPCCKESAIAPSSAPARAVPAPAPTHIAAPVATIALPGAIEIAPQRIAVAAHDAAEHREPSPPLFLLNAQFLI